MAGLQDDLDEEAAIADGRDLRLVQIERLAAELHEAGVDFRVERGKVLQSAQDRDRDREYAVDLGQNHYRIGIVSDTHLGSKFEQLTALQQFYDYGDEREVDLFIHGGDLTQGPDEMHKGMVHEVHAHGADCQVDYATQVYPKSKRGAKTYVLGGNHDASHLKQGGVNVVRRFCKARDDAVYLGQDAAFLTIGPLRSYVIHPDGGGAYAKSYKGQKLSESLPIEKDVRLLLIGHYHNFANFRDRRTHVFQLGCFQSKYGWLARKGLHPEIEGLILDLWLDDEGRIARLVNERVVFEPITDDWNHDVSNEVSRAWNEKGLELPAGLSAADYGEAV